MNDLPILIEVNLEMATATFTIKYYDVKNTGFLGTTVNVEEAEQITSGKIDTNKLVLTLMKKAEKTDYK
ncbi:hypothetical protein ACWOAH_04265 [Vagococcus vulneris]|uniref:Uncharacterized protein n=1 Tax=Vagococcus vulneris TaxID=1977869 RepID=A0A430A0F3_9ENTE|nr:hypothetical protein [Vagococcus vulneris]RST99807.1 hypothetical protein CBF37_03520 [Vagococcus vulneris]